MKRVIKCPKCNKGALKERVCYEDCYFDLELECTNCDYILQIDSCDFDRLEYISCILHKIFIIVALLSAFSSIFLYYLSYNIEATILIGLSLFAFFGTFIKK